ncbi:MAG: hypothetical protein M3R65_09920 [Gemmatimonadota bacterium]|nr:hypothetical protein [Gemmatimonadota bacterium]
MARRTLTANDLRALAEAADGVRDRPAYVVWGPDGPELKAEPPSASADVIFECATSNIVPNRAKLRSMTIDPPMVTTGGAAVTDLATLHDAMFWSEAAVEKFVLPYYIRSGGPELAERIRKAFNHPSVIAIAHLPDSAPILLTAIRSRNGMEALTLSELEALL